MVLMCGHGFIAVGATVPLDRVVYTATNCQLEQAGMQLRSPRYLSVGEAEAYELTNSRQPDRPWCLWVAQFASSLLSKGSRHA